MSLSYRHIILTRFNLQFERDSTLHLSPAWLDNRFALFETYCLPSLQQQTCKDFTWILLADSQTPDAQRRRLLSYSRTMPQIEVLFCPFYEDVNLLYRHVGEQYCAGHDWLLSSRLDNDDMLANDFVEQLHACMTSLPPVPCALTYPVGAQYFVSDNVAFRIGFKNNHFLSFVEDKNHIRTCLGIDHTKIPRSSLHSIDDRDMWCEVVHSNNICNDYSPRFHYYRQPPQGQYPVLLPHTAWKARIPFLTAHWAAFRAAQVQRMLQRLHFFV